MAGHVLRSAVNHYAGAEFERTNQHRSRESVVDDQGNAGADLGDLNAGPQVRRHLERVGPAAVQRDHPPLALGLRGPLDGLGPFDRGRVQPVEQALRLRPGLLRGVPGDHVQPDAEPQLAPGRLGLLAHVVELARDRGGRLARSLIYSSGAQTL